MLMSDWSSDVCSSDLKAVPVDILGGGYVVAPPSHGGVSAYQFQTGSLDDLPSLPRLKRDVAESDRPATPVELVNIGKRNDSLWRACMRHAKSCASFDDLLCFAYSSNMQSLVEPLTQREGVTLHPTAGGQQGTAHN